MTSGRMRAGCSYLVTLLSWLRWDPANGWEKQKQVEMAKERVYHAESQNSYVSCDIRKR